MSMVMGEEGKGGTLLGLPELDTEVDVSERGRKREDMVRRRRTSSQTVWVWIFLQRY